MITLTGTPQTLSIGEDGFLAVIPFPSISWNEGDLLIITWYDLGNDPILSVTNTGSGLLPWSPMSDGTTSAKAASVATNAGLSDCEVWSSRASENGSGVITVTRALVEAAAPVALFSLAGATSVGNVSDAVAVAVSPPRFALFPSVTSKSINTQALIVGMDTSSGVTTVAVTGYTLLLHAAIGLGPGANYTIYILLENATNGPISTVVAPPQGLKGGSPAVWNAAFTILLIQPSTTGAVASPCSWQDSECPAETSWQGGAGPPSMWQG